MFARRRSRTLIVVPSVSVAPSKPSYAPRLGDLLLPASGSNAVPPEKLTPRERMNEIVSILARGFLRKAAGIPPFAKPVPNGTAPLSKAPPGRAT